MQTAPSGAAPKGIQDLTECPDSTKITVSYQCMVTCTLLKAALYRQHYATHTHTPTQDAYCDLMTIAAIIGLCPMLRCSSENFISFVYSLLHALRNISDHHLEHQAKTRQAWRATRQRSFFFFEVNWLHGLDQATTNLLLKKILREDGAAATCSDTHPTALFA